MTPAGLTAAVPDAPSAADAAVLARIDAACSWLSLVTGPPGDGAWFRLDQLEADGDLDRLCDAIRAQTGGIRGAEAAAVVSGTTYLLSWLLLCGPVLGQRRPAPTAGELWVGLDPDGGRLGRLAIAPTVGWHDVGSGPGAVDHRETTATLVGVLEPLVEGLARRRLLGRRALWGSIADAVAYQALAVTSGGGGCSESGMALGEQLLSRLPGRVEPPEWLTVWRGRREETLRLKQACCLAYRQEGHGWCTTCPLADETTRAVQLEQWLAAR